MEALRTHRIDEGGDMRMESALTDIDGKIGRDVEEIYVGPSALRIAKLIPRRVNFSQGWFWTTTEICHDGRSDGLAFRQRPDGNGIGVLQEVIRMILEAYYEPQFSDRSHGFRPNRGCHTALSNVTTHWTGVRWFVEGDIKGCFDNIDHDVLLSVLGEKLHDNRFLRLLKFLLKAGYVEDWKYGHTLSGTPQGGIVSPILANVYLDRLDKFVENVLIPAHTRGTDRRDNREYTRLLNRMHYHKKVGHHSLAADLRKQLQQLPSRDPYDPGYRRLRYVRYADDFVLGFIGPKAEAQQVKESLETFLQDSLKLELSREKTLIPHATSLIHDDDYGIVVRYQSEYRGVVQYYLLAYNVHHFGRLYQVMEMSLARTLAAKHKSTARKMRRKYKGVVETEHGPRVCHRVVKQQDNGKRPLVAQFGGIPLQRQRQAVLGVCPRIRSWRRKPPRNNLLTVIWTLSWSN